MQRELDDDEESGTSIALGLAHPRTLLEMVAHGAELTPEAPALVAPERTSITYRALHAHMIDTRRALRSAGVGRADTVAMIADGGPTAAATFLAVAAAAVCAPLNPAYKARELDFYLSDLEAQTRHHIGESRNGRARGRRVPWDHGC